MPTEKSPWPLKDLLLATTTQYRYLLDYNILTLGCFVSRHETRNWRGNFLLGLRGFQLLRFGRTEPSGVGFGYRILLYPIRVCTLTIHELLPHDMQSIKFSRVLYQRKRDKTLVGILSLLSIAVRARLGTLLAFLRYYNLYYKQRHAR